MEDWNALFSIWCDRVSFILLVVYNQQKTTNKNLYFSVQFLSLKIVSLFKTLLVFNLGCHWLIYLTVNVFQYRPIRAISWFEIIKFLWKIHHENNFQVVQYNLLVCMSHLNNIFEVDMHFTCIKWYVNWVLSQIGQWIFNGTLVVPHFMQVFSTITFDF